MESISYHTGSSPSLFIEVFDDIGDPVISEVTLVVTRFAGGDRWEIQGDIPATPDGSYTFDLSEVQSVGDYRGWVVIWDLDTTPDGESSLDFPIYVLE